MKDNRMSFSVSEGASNGKFEAIIREAKSTGDDRIRLCLRWKS